MADPSAYKYGSEPTEITTNAVSAGAEAVPIPGTVIPGRDVVTG
jgi:hypothetical protein